MAYNNLTFKKLDNGYYEAFFKGNSLSIFFKVPDGFDIRDYPISTYGPCKEIENESAYFELTKEPQDTYCIAIASDVGLNFPKEFPIKIGSCLILGSNKDMTIKTIDSPDLYFDNLRIENNKKSSITFTKTKLRKFSPEWLKDNKLEIEQTIIKSNENINLVVGDSCSINKIDNFTVISRGKNKLDLSKVRYIEIDSVSLSPEQDFNSFSVDSDLFISHHSSISLVKMEGNNNKEKAKSSSIKMINGGGECLTRLDIKGTNISFFDGGTLEVDAKELELGEIGDQNQMIKFWGKNQLKAKEKIAIKNSDFIDTTVNSENLELNIVSSNFKKSSINFTNNIGTNSVSEVEYLTISNSALDNISGNLRGNISWVKANNITIGKDARFSHNVIQNHLPEPTYLLNLNHITLAPDAFISFNFGENFIKSLNNCYLEGELNIQSDCPYKINSSTIKNDNDEESTIFISSNGGNPLIESVLFNGDVEIKNVDELNYSEISNSKILSPYRVNASNLFLCDETITNFNANNVEHKVDSTVTNELDIL